MPKFKITYGLSRVEESEDIIEAETLEEAQGIAYEAAMDIASSWLVWDAEPAEDEES